MFFFFLLDFPWLCSTDQGLALGPSFNLRASGAWDVAISGTWDIVPCHYTERHIKADVGSGNILKPFYQDPLPSLSLVTLATISLVLDYLKPKTHVIKIPAGLVVI